MSARNCQIKTRLSGYKQNKDQVDRNIECVFLGKGIENQMVNPASRKENTDFVAEPIPEGKCLSLNGDSGQDKDKRT